MKKLVFLCICVLSSLSFCFARVGETPYNIALCNYPLGIMEEYSRDTLYILPGEELRYKLDVAEMNKQKAIIGVTADMTYFTSGDMFSFLRHDPTFNSGTEYAFGEITVEEILSGGRTTWLANSSLTPIVGFNLGYFFGIATKSYSDGSCWLNAYAKVATKDLQTRELSLTKVVKKVDRVRCDVDGNGVVNKEDLRLTKSIIDNGLYNFYFYPENMYTQSGYNTGAAAAWGSHPDFLSVALCNIFVKNPNDPLVKALGIGQKFSAQEFDSFEDVAVGSYVSGDNLVVDAPGADIVDVISYLPDGKVFQATLPSDGSISIPDPSAKYEVRAVKFKAPEVTTALTKMVKEKINVFHHKDELRISGSGKISVKVFNLEGLLVHSLVFEDEAMISSSTWKRGVCVVRVNDQVYKIMK